MKKYLLIVIFMFISSVAFGWGVEVSWDPNPESDIAGYNIYKSIVSGIYIKGIYIATVDSTTQSAVITNVPDGIHYFVVTAFDTSGNESEFSDEVFILLDSAPPAKPKNVRLKKK